MKKAVFLDRDGVINDNQQHVNKPEDLVLYPGVGAAIRRLTEVGYQVFVVTNQGGVGLGYMTPEALDAIHSKLKAELAKADAHLTDIKACIHRPQAGCKCRKPKPGMLLDLADKHGINLAASWMIGDRDTDCLAGKAAGVHRNIQIGGVSEWSDYTAANLVEAAEIILSHYAT